MGRHMRILLFNGKPLLRIAPLLIASLLFARQASADLDQEDSADGGEGSSQPARTVSSASLSAGYRFVSPDGPGAAAAPYERLRPGAVGGLSLATLGSDLKLKVDGDIRHEDDYAGELSFDYGGFVRLQAGSEALWHNLLRESLNPGIGVQVLEQDPGASYGFRTTVTQARSRIRLGNNPIHLNVGYWELSREGEEQLRFSDHYWSGGTIVSQAARVDRITREGSAGVDGHLGPVDLSYGFRIRDFVNRAADPRYNYANNAYGVLLPGSQAHDTIPDSRSVSHTFKLFSDMSGGLVASAAYTFTQRENRGGHGDAVPSRRPEDTLHLAAGDISYTPSRLYSFAVKYRHQEIDRSPAAAVFYPFATTQNVLVAPPPSLIKDVVTASLVVRPYPKMIYRFEYSAEAESRDNVRNPQSLPGDVTALHGESRLTNTGRATVYWRPVNGVKVNASYSYAACDNPAYRASFGDRHIGKLLLTYAQAGRWGIVANYLVQRESGESSATLVPPLPPDFIVSTGTDPSRHNLSRTSRNNSANASVWFSPLERLTFTTSYSYLKAVTDQALLLSGLSANSLAGTRYRTDSHVYGIDAVYAVSELLDLSLAFQQVFSRGSLNLSETVPFTSTSGGPVQLNTSGGITPLTRLDTTETGLSARADWRISSHLGTALDYTFRRYAGDSVYDGSVHTTMVSMKARW